MSNDHEPHGGRDVAIDLVLLDRCRESNEEKHDPGDTHLGEHLQVELTNAGVEPNAKEEVVEGITRSILRSEVECKRSDVDHNRDEVSG